MNIAHQAVHSVRHRDNGRDIAMDTIFSFSRRTLLLAGVGAALTAAIDPRPARAGAPRQVRLAPAPAKATLAGSQNPQTAVWAYDGKVPGPTLRLRRGEPVRIIVENKLDEDTTVHWHGIRLPNAMDGVPGLTQPPIRPGETFTYEFTPPDSGTFRDRPPANSLQQLGRGMAGALIIEESEPVAVDREILWMIGDWRLGQDTQIVAGFGNAMEAAMAGRIGNLV